MRVFILLAIHFGASVSSLLLSLAFFVLGIRPRQFLRTLHYILAFVMNNDDDDYVLLTMDGNPHALMQKSVAKAGDCIISSTQCATECSKTNSFCGARACDDLCASLQSWRYTIFMHTNKLSTEYHKAYQSHTRVYLYNNAPPRVNDASPTDMTQSVMRRDFPFIICTYCTPG